MQEKYTFPRFFIPSSTSFQLSLGSEFNLLGLRKRGCSYTVTVTSRAEFLYSGKVAFKLLLSHSKRVASVTGSRRPVAESGGPSFPLERLCESPGSLYVPCSYVTADIQ